jgi:hypothetical protein
VSERACWCGGTHPERTDDLTVAWETLWHEVAAAARLPVAVAWLNGHLVRALERHNLALVNGVPRRVGSDGLTAKERRHCADEFDRTIGRKSR